LVRKKGSNEMSEDANELVLRLHREALEHLDQLPCAPTHEADERPHASLPDAEPGSPVAAEWEIFRQEVERLIREGYRGKFALVKAEQPILVWDTLRDAAQAARLLYGEGPSMVQQILPYLRPLRVGGNRLCRD
jgi:hypothetical protein